MIEGWRRLSTLVPRFVGPCARTSDTLPAGYAASTIDDQQATDDRGCRAAKRPTELRPVSRTEHEQHRAEQRSESRHHDRMHAGQAGLMEGAGRVAGALPFEGEIDGLRAATEFDGEARRRSECRHGSSEGYGRFARSLPSRTIRRPKLRPPVTIGASCQSSRRTLTPGSRRIRPAAPSCARSTRGYAAASRGLRPLARTTPSHRMRYPPAGVSATTRASP